MGVAQTKLTERGIAMGFNRECMEWFTELSGDFGFPESGGTHVMYYRLIIAAKRLAAWAMIAPDMEPDLRATAQKVQDAALGMDPEDERLVSLGVALQETMDRIGNGVGDISSVVAQLTLERDAARKNYQFMVDKYGGGAP